MFMEIVFITSKHSYLRYCKLLSGTRIITGMEEKGKGYYTICLPCGKPGYEKGELPIYSQLPVEKNLLSSHFSRGKPI